MCKDCVKQQYPDRGSICLETGSYLMNFVGCAACHRKEPMRVENKEEDEEDGEEIVTYQHVCDNCGHMIANHEYKFEVDEEFQLYEMYCLLCGRGEDMRSCLPVDPRK